MTESRPAPGGPKSGIESIIDAVADLLQTLVDWLRQEAAAIVRDKIVLPIQRLGLTLASAAAAAALLVVGLIFIAVALYLFLARAVGHPFALLIIGGAYVVASGVFLVIKARSMQK
ncbi:MAG: phage holin family protein [Coriobacteriia bacterium]